MWAPEAAELAPAGVVSVPAAEVWAPGAVESARAEEALAPVWVDSRREVGCCYRPRRRMR